MTTKDRQKWDARYLEHMGGIEAATLLRKYWTVASVGTALDIACGNGRNSLFLAEKGFSVEAVDISTVATNHLMNKNKNLTIICADLDSWIIPKNHYDLIVNIHFLDRRLFPMISNGLKPGGVLIFESFMDGKKDLYCLKENELLQAFHSFRIVYYEEKKVAHAKKFDYTASLVGVNTDSKQPTEIKNNDMETKKCGF